MLTQKWVPPSPLENNMTWYQITSRSWPSWLLTTAKISHPGQNPDSFLFLSARRNLFGNYPIPVKEIGLQEGNGTFFNRLMKVLKAAQLNRAINPSSLPISPMPLRYHTYIRNPFSFKDAGLHQIFCYQWLKV